MNPDRDQWGSDCFYTKLLRLLHPYRTENFNNLFFAETSYSIDPWRIDLELDNHFMPSRHFLPSFGLYTLRTNPRISITTGSSTYVQSNLGDVSASFLLRTTEERMTTWKETATGKIGYNLNSLLYCWRTVLGVSGHCSLIRAYKDLMFRVK